MSQRVVSPPLAEIDALPTPLTGGERQVLDFFLRLLPEEWEIYIQPHLNGLRPDFVLLHPENGIAVFEVKDWDLDAMKYAFKGNPPRLHARRGNGSPFRTENPLEKVMLYKEEIHNLYCASLPSRVGFGVITAGVIFPRASSKRLDELFGPAYGSILVHPQNMLVGEEELSSRRIESVFPYASRKNPSMTEEVARDLRLWLVEPRVSSEQREPLRFDSKQERLVKSRTESGYRRVRGSAGSGKSLVLAARAAELGAAGKKVLVVTFNITLLNYLKDLAVRHSREGAQGNVTWLNFHTWCKRVCLSTGDRDRYSGLGPASGRGDDWAEELSELIVDVMRENPRDEDVHYDAILVDEGQDFQLPWWNALRAALKPKGEMLLVADPTQDLYGTARAWTEDAMRGAGFRGDWTTLDRSYRLPDPLVPLTRRFGEQFLPADDMRVLPQPIQTALDLGGTHLRWIQATEEQELEACVSEILSLPGRVEGAPVPWADVHFLTGSKRFGKAVVDSLEAHGIRVIHTFYDGDQERRRKLAFFKGAPRVKATTLHSFKGWEARAIVVHLAHLYDVEKMAAAYAALTRLKEDDQSCALSVVSTWPDFDAYGRTWPVFRTWLEAKAEDDSQDLAEFASQWRSLMTALARRKGVSVEPGDEVMAENRVVDLDLATIRWNGRCVRLVDETQDSAEKVESVLEAQGHRVMRARPDDPGLYDRLVAALES